MGSADKRPSPFRRLYPIPYLAPGLIAMAVGTLVPAAVSIYYAFTNYSVLHLQDWHFTGLANFRRILLGANRAEFAGVMGWTLTWATLSTLLSFALGLALALLLNNKDLPERNLYRTVLILPWALPATITVLCWAGLFSTSFGPINRLLGQIGLAPVPWLTDPFWARVTCLLVNLWLAFPFMMTACLGALQSIPEELYDAAHVDGATGWQSFRVVTLPLLRSSTLPLVISSFAMHFGNFGVIYLLTNGGPYTRPGSWAGATDLITTYMYKIAFASTAQDYGLAAASGMLIFLMLGSLTALNSLLTGAFREVDL